MALFGFTYKRIMVGTSENPTQTCCFSREPTFHRILLHVQNTILCITANHPRFIERDRLFSRPPSRAPGICRRRLPGPAHAAARDPPMPLPGIRRHRIYPPRRPQPLGHLRFGSPPHAGPPPPRDATASRLWTPPPPPSHQDTSGSNREERRWGSGARAGEAASQPHRLPAPAGRR